MHVRRSAQASCPFRERGKKPFRTVRTLHVGFLTIFYSNDNHSSRLKDTNVKKKRKKEKRRMTTVGKNQNSHIGRF